MKSNPTDCQGRSGIGKVEGIQKPSRLLHRVFCGLAQGAQAAEQLNVSSHGRPPIEPLHIVRGRQSTKMANCGVSLIEYDLNQPPPPDKCLPDNVPAHLVFSSDEPVSNPKAWVCLLMVKDLHKEWIFMIVSLHKS